MTDSSPTITVPATPIVELYDQTHARGVGREDRLALTRGFVAIPGALAGLFAYSARRMADFAPGDARFYRTERTATIGDSVVKTHHVALRLERDKPTTVIPGGHDDTSSLVPGVATVAAEQLAFRYVDRELVGTHVGSDVQHDGTAVRMDLCLSTVDDATAVIGELKIATEKSFDKDPFAALIQAMACAAQLVSNDQYGRLGQHAADRGESLRDLPDSPFVDLYIVLHNYVEHTHIPELLHETEQLSALLLAQPSFSRYVRRIACVMTDTVDDRIVARRRFAFERPEAL